MLQRFLFVIITICLVSTLSFSCKSTSKLSSMDSDTDSSVLQTPTRIRVSQIIDDECSAIGPMNINGISMYSYKCPYKEQGLVYAQSWDEEITGNDISELCKIINSKRSTLAFMGYSDSEEFVNIPLEIIVCFSETGTSFKGVVKDVTKLHPSVIK